MSNTLKTTKNTVKIGGEKYYSFQYFKQQKKNFCKDKFVRIGDVSYYLPKV